MNMILYINFIYLFFYNMLILNLDLLTSLYKFVICFYYCYYNKYNIYIKTLYNEFNLI